MGTEALHHPFSADSIRSILICLPLFQHGCPFSQICSPFATCPSLKQLWFDDSLMDQGQHRHITHNSFDFRWVPGPCDTCIAPKLCTWSIACLCSPVSAGQPCSAPFPSQHWRKDHAAHLQDDKNVMKVTGRVSFVWCNYNKLEHAFTLCEKVDTCSIPSNIKVFRQAPP